MEKDAHLQNHEKSIELYKQQLMKFFTKIKCDSKFRKQYFYCFV